PALLLRKGRARQHHPARAAIALQMKLLQARQRRGRRAPATKSNGQRCGADENRCSGISIESGAEPAVAGVVFRIEPRCLPQGHAAVVRTAGVRIADTLYDGQPSTLEEFHGVPKRGMQSGPVIDLEQPILRQAQSLAVLEIAVVLERHDGIESVVASAK